MIDRFLSWDNHVEAKSGKIKGSCQPPLIPSDLQEDVVKVEIIPAIRSDHSAITLTAYRNHHVDPLFGNSTLVY